MTAPTDRLVAEALAKSGLLWVTSEAGSAPLWHVVVDGVAYAVSGEGEQFMPDHSGRVAVVARSKETRARLISFDALASPVEADTQEWERAVFALRGGRLNAPAGDLAARWRESGIVTRFEPLLDTVVLRGQQLPAPEGYVSPEAVSPAPTTESDAEQAASAEYAAAEQADAAAAAPSLTTGQPVRVSPAAGSGDDGGAATTEQAASAEADRVTP